MIRRPPRSTRVRSSAASDVYKRQEPDDAPVLEVDGGPELQSAHHAASRKFRRIWRPVSDDFSGWNWHPQTFPFSTTDGNGPPYSVVATMSFSSAPSGRKEWTK